MADTPCLGCKFPAACGTACAADEVDAEIVRIVAEHHSGPERVLRDQETALRPFREDEGGRLYQGDVLATTARHVTPKPYYQLGGES